MWRYLRLVFLIVVGTAASLVAMFFVGLLLLGLPSG